MRSILMVAVLLLVVGATSAQAADGCGENDSCASTDSSTSEASAIGPPERPCQPACFNTGGG